MRYFSYELNGRRCSPDRTLTLGPPLPWFFTDSTERGVARLLAVTSEILLYCHSCLLRPELAIRLPPPMLRECGRSLATSRGQCRCSLPPSLHHHSTDNSTHQTRRSAPGQTTTQLYHASPAYELRPRQRPCLIKISFSIPRRSKNLVADADSFFSLPFLPNTCTAQPTKRRDAEKKKKKQQKEEREEGRKEGRLKDKGACKRAGRERKQDSLCIN